MQYSSVGSVTREGYEVSRSALSPLWTTPSSNHGDAPVNMHSVTRSTASGRCTQQSPVTGCRRPLCSKRSWISMTTDDRHPQKTSRHLCHRQRTQSAGQSEHGESPAWLPLSLTDHQHLTRQPPPPATSLLVHMAPVNRSH